MTAEPLSAGSCPSCGAPVGAHDNFCEPCGAELSPAAVSGEPAAGQACGSCGREAPSCPDHQEMDLGLVAGVTDRGRRDKRNEDVMALATAHAEAGPTVVAVVCDGVSTSYHPHEASLAAARAGAGVLLSAARTGEDPGAASVAAIMSALDAVTVLAHPPDAEPSTTYISAVMVGDVVTLCWLGDSRGYWLGAATGPAARLLTRDDSLAEEKVAAGELALADVGASSYAHVLTGWVGHGADPFEPHVTTFEPPGPGALLLCSDGLWNYQPNARGLAEMALPAALTDPLAAARTLVSFALEAGGSDNITAVVMPCPPARAARHSHFPAGQPAAVRPPAPVHIPQCTAAASHGIRHIPGGSYR